MAYKTKVQLIERKNSEQWYIFFPMAIARGMEFEKGEEIEMVIRSQAEIIIKRPSIRTAKKKKSDD